MGNQVNNTLTYLDLLELVKIGKQPRLVKYMGRVFAWSDSEGTYVDSGASGLARFLDYEIGLERSMERCCDRRDIEVLANRLRILDTVERNYLEKALVPLKAERVRKSTLDGGRFCILFQMKDGTFFRLPPFDAGTMYAGMEPDRWYDLKDLLSKPARPVSRK